MFTVVRSNRLESLVDALAERLREPLSDPFEPDVLVVPSPGMERWLSMALAERMGVAANLVVFRPRQAVELVLQRFLGEPELRLEDWSRQRLTWRILGVLPRLLEQPVFEPVRRYAADGGQERLYQVATRAAHLFDQYGVYRPQMLAEWSDGADPEEWQAALWREVGAGEGTLLHHAQRAYATGEPLMELPERITLFGVSTLPPLHLDVLEMASQADGNLALFSLSPSAQYWADLKPQHVVGSVGRRAPDLSEEKWRREVGHPLLASCGQLGGDFQYLLVERVESVGAELDLYTPPEPTTILGRLQADLFDVRWRSAAERLPLPQGDDSLWLLGAHGPLREVEVLRDRILATLEAHPDLRPRDIVIMTPDLATYAPLVEAVFGVPEGDPLHLPFAISDRSSLERDDIWRLLFAVYALHRSRWTAHDLLDVVRMPPVVERLGLSESELRLVEELVQEAAISWGRDAGHRESLGQPGLDRHTWAMGLRRMLWGAAFPDGATFGGLPLLEGVEGARADWVGRIAELVMSLSDLTADLERERTLAQWVEHTGRMLRALTPSEGDLAERATKVIYRLGDLLKAGAEAGEELGLSLEIYLQALQEFFGEDRLQGSFLRGGITVCEMLPLRSVPFEVVCLLGMQDGAFPRSDARLEMDLMRKAPRRGDRSRSRDDRYIFLEALLSARRQLVVTWQSADMQQQRHRGPSVVVSELLDLLDATFEVPEGKARDARFVQHPLQPFSPAYIAGDGTELFTFDGAAAAGAQALVQQQLAPVPSFLDPSPAPMPLREQITLGELSRFFQDPVAWLHHRRLGVRVADIEDVLVDREPLADHGLAAWKTKDALRRALLEGIEAEEAVATHQHHHIGPVGVFGELAMSESRSQVEKGIALVDDWVRSEPLEDVRRSHEIAGMVIEGDRRQVRAEGVVHFRWSKVASTKDPNNGNLRARAWLEHLFRQLDGELPASARRTRGIGRLDKAVAVLWDWPAMPPAEALDRLTEVVEHYRRAHQEVLLSHPTFAFVDKGKDKSWEPPDQVAKALKKIQDQLTFRAADQVAWSTVLGESWSWPDDPEATMERARLLYGPMKGGAA